MDLDRSVLIVGAGHAGGSLVTLLRQNGWSGSIRLVGEEAAAPYQRPPLSKAWLKGEVTLDSLFLRDRGYYDDQNITLDLGTTVTGLDRAKGQITTVNDKGARGELPFDILVLATGVRPRPLTVPGAELKGIYSLRDVADAEALRGALAAGRRLVIIGGGYIGLEVASAARAMGLDVVVVERETRLLARVASAEISQFYQELHEERGVTVLPGAAVVALQGEAGHVSAVELGDGRRLDADVVLVGIGGVPNSALAEAAGLSCRDGIVIDEVCATSDPRIFAIGDVTRRALPQLGREGRLESVQSALEQARQVALHLCGKPAPAREVPWFWSDQYDVKLQIAGLLGEGGTSLVRGDPRSGRFAVFHLSPQNQVRAVEAVNMPAEFMAGRQWIAQGRVVSPEKLADPAMKIRDAA